MSKSSLTLSCHGKFRDLFSTHLFFSVSLISQEPVLHIDSATLDAWEYGQSTNAEALLSAAIPTSQNSVLASWALVRARSDTGT